VIVLENRRRRKTPCHFKGGIMSEEVKEENLVTGEIPPPEASLKEKTSHEILHSELFPMLMNKVTEVSKRMKEEPGAIVKQALVYTLVHGITAPPEGIPESLRELLKLTGEAMDIIYNIHMHTVLSAADKLQQQEKKND
jgi:hypothetical protein